MTFRDAEAKSFQPSEWDTFIAQSEEGGPFLQYAWLEASAPGWKAWEWSDSSGCVARMPVRIKKRLFWTAFRQPLFSMYWGICFRRNTDISTQKEIYKDAIVKLKASVHLLDICLSPMVTEIGLPEVEGVFYTRKPTYRLELNDAIESGFSAATRRQIRKSERTGFICQSSVQHKDVLEIFRLNPHIMSDIELQQFEKIIQRTSPKENLKLWTIRTPEEKLVACGYFMFDASFCYYIAGAVHPEFRSSGVMSLLMFRVMEYAKSIGCSCFDFEGSSIPGVARFFEGFGAQRITYLCIRANQLPRPIQWISKYT
jgi:GNAT superfamily N-acetyltransferase